MTKFISNVNQYLSEMKIKQTYLSLVTGIDKNKISRLLTGAQVESGTDMEKIAYGLGKKVNFFLADSVSILSMEEALERKTIFHNGEPTGKQEETVKLLVELMENIDEIMSAKSRFANMAN